MKGRQTVEWPAAVYFVLNRTQAAASRAERITR